MFGEREREREKERERKMAVLTVSEPTYPALCCRGAGCFSNVLTYLPGTVLQGCRLYKRCGNLPAGHCVAGVQTV